MDKKMILVDDVYKEYRLGVIGGGTLQSEIQSRWARFRGKEDPNTKIGSKVPAQNERFMALNGISFSVNKGDTLGIIGHNGAGKSTLLKLLSRVTAPTRGKIYLNGRISSMLEVGTGFHPELTGRENIYLNGAILGMSRKEIDSKLDEIIAFSECSQFIDTPVKRYSSGMYVKLAFSVAAHLDSDILVMDEVLAVGDMKFQQKCLGKMGDVANYEGRTVLYVSHNMNTIRQLCNRCIVMDHGKILYDGETDEAIDLYLEGKYADTGLYKDYTDRQIPDMCSMKAKITSFAFSATDTNCFDADQKIMTTLHVKCKKAISNAYIRYTFASAEGSKIGASISAEGLSFRENEESDVQITMDPACLTRGKYVTTITFYETNEYGTQGFIDLIPDAFVFEITSNSNSIKGLNWEARKLGHVVLPGLYAEKLESKNRD